MYDVDENAAAYEFTTERKQPGSQEWQAGRPIALLFEPGETVPLTRLHWRDRDGAETDISFEPGMTGFFGVRTAADGTTAELRGGRVEPAAARGPHRFQEVGGQEGELRLLVDDGGGPTARVGWVEQDAGGGAVVLRSTADTDGDLTGRVRRVDVSGEHAEAGEVGENLLDQTGAKWLTFQRFGAWVLFTMAEPVTVRHYVLDSADDFTERDPRDWKLKGSNDAETWTVLDTRSDESFRTRRLARGFDVPGRTGDASYRYFLLEIEANHGESATQLNRVRLHSQSPGYESFTGYRRAPGAAPRPYAGVAHGVGAGPVGGPQLNTAEQWRSYLAEYGADILRVGEVDPDDITDEQQATGWLGYEGASEERIATLEARLGTRLPPSYRSFLATSDGWTTISTFMYELLSTDDVEWAKDSDFGEIIDEFPDAVDVPGPVLLVSGEGDAQYWLLDAGDVAPDGEWAAYIWASWYPGLGERHRSFADLVAAERASFEELSGGNGKPVHPEGAAEVLAEGRRAALRGDVDDALDAFERAETKGSGAAMYLKVVLSAFLGEFQGVQYDLARTLHHGHVVAEVGADQLGAEAIPLFTAATRWDHNHGHVPLREAVRSLGDSLPPGLLPDADEVDALDADAWITARRTPEPPAFERALESARALTARGADDDAWAVIREALPEWYPTTENRIAPVVLLTDPALRAVVTPRRMREAVCTPRGDQAAPGEQ